MLTNYPEEQKWFQSKLNRTQELLEYGAGSSTIENSFLVWNIVSIEHDQKWFDIIQSRISEQNIKNVELFLQKNNLPWDGNLNRDQSYEQFKDYVDFPLSLNRKFDIIFIDGRARVACARNAIKLLKENGVIIMHDYGEKVQGQVRTDYFQVLDFMEVIEHCRTCCLFKPKS